MKLQDIVNRTVPPEPWAEGENMPWEDPGFSYRMLNEHLNPEHDGASRRPKLIDEQVEWLHEQLLDGSPARILDLGCGPGLYAIRLAKLGHDVIGIDLSPTSVEYARDAAAKAGVSPEFIQGDFRNPPLDIGYDLVMQIYGVFNVFRREDAANLIEKWAETLVPGDQLLLEVARPETIRKLGETGARWSGLASGPFCDEPHLYLDESFWDEEQRVATNRIWTIDAGTGNVARFAQSLASYRAEEYKELLLTAGLGNVELLSDYPGAHSTDDHEGWMLVGRSTDR